MHKKRFSAILKLQVHSIRRNDDTVQVLKKSIETSPQFSRFLTVQMRWSKNIHKQQDYSRQALKGSTNEKSCVVLGPVLFLEKWIVVASAGVDAASRWLFFLDGSIDSSSRPAVLELQENK